MTYRFTHGQLLGILQDTCARYEEYRDVHGYTPDLAYSRAVSEVLDTLTPGEINAGYVVWRLDERELIEDGRQPGT